MMQIKEIVNEFITDRLAGVDRIETLIRILTKLNITYYKQVSDLATNVVVEFRPDKENPLYDVYGAHYDVWGTSIGINDNTVAVAMLIKLATNPPNKNLDIVFFDKEEYGMHGSVLYLETANLENIRAAKIFDVIGVGESVLIGGDDWLVEESSKQNVSKVANTYKIKQLLPSDNFMFRLYRVPVVLYVTVPNDDVIIYDEISKGLVEEVGLRAMAEFYESFHNRSKDNKVELINWGLVNKILEGLVG